MNWEEFKELTPDEKSKEFLRLLDANHIKYQFTKPDMKHPVVTFHVNESQGRAKWEVDENAGEVKIYQRDKGTGQQGNMTLFTILTQMWGIGSSYFTIISGEKSIQKKIKIEFQWNNAIKAAKIIPCCQKWMKKTWDDLEENE